MEHIIKVRLDKKIKRASSVESFRFIPEERLEFTPGQFLQIIFDAKDRGNSELNKHLSFSSSPLRGYIEVTKRLGKSLFSKRLRELKTGDEVVMRAPLGNCVLNNTDENIGFLVGGIGITPVISIIEYIIDKNLNADVCLFYSNRSEDEIAFKEELNRWQSKNSKIKVIYTITDYEPEDRSCAFGRIDKKLVMGKDKRFLQRVVFIFGPPGMVDMMRNLCIEVGVVSSEIKTEKFLGY